MKLKLDQVDCERLYVAQICGLHPKWRFRRRFLDGESRRIRSANGRPARTRWTYHLADGLYEIKVGGDLKYLAVVNNRSVKIQVEHLEVVASLAKRSETDLMRLYESWAKSPRRSSDSLVAIAEKATADILARKSQVERQRSQKEREQKKLSAKRRRERVSTMSAREAFRGSDGADTKGFHRRLEKLGFDGAVAAALFRCQKASRRAKAYRGEYSDLSYQRKAEALDKVCDLLSENENFKWGWKHDPAQDYASWVLYVDLPQGQVSFHSPHRGSGPNYEGDWDRQRASEDRILAYCDELLEGDRVLAADLATTMA